MKSAVKIFILFLILTQTASAEWTRQESNTLSWLYDIHFINESRGWIVGSNGEFLTTINGGKTWEKQVKFTGDNIKRVYFSNEKNGWLLCERDIYSLGTESPSYLLKTTDGGLSWEKIDFVGGKQRKRVTNIFFSANNFGLAIGESGALFAMEDDKSDWRLKPSPARYLLADGVFTDNFHGTIVGGGGTILFTEDAGVSWKQASIWGKSETKLNSVFYLNKYTGWAVGEEGKIFQTVSGGKRWRIQNSTVTKNLNGIFFVNTAEGWIVGDDGTILHTTTAGNVWKQMETRTNHKLEKVFFVGDKGWAVGFGGTILIYEAGDNSHSKRPKLKNR
jgi:photosystem II stability/assembly factor-like uncharacterized protein